MEPWEISAEQQTRIATSEWKVPDHTQETQKYFGMNLEIPEEKYPTPGLNVLAIASAVILIGLCSCVGSLLSSIPH